MTKDELLNKCRELVRTTLPEWGDATKNEIAKRIFNQIEPLHHTRRNKRPRRPLADEPGGDNWAERAYFGEL